MNEKDAILTFFSDIIRAELGIVYTQDNFFQLEQRLEDLTKSLGFDNLTDFYEKAKLGLTFQQKADLLDSATNNETLFFRDPNIYAAIEQTVLGDQDLLARGGKLRIWSAACSMGQEPYSLAMMLVQSPFSKGRDFEILATDIADKAIKHTADGFFSDLEMSRGLPPEYKEKFFTHHTSPLPGRWQVVGDIRNKVRTKKVNLISHWAEDVRDFDLILCRNVLIYQTLENKQKVIQKMHERLNPKGYLVLGGAESLLGLSDAFEVIRTAKSVIYRKKS